MPTVVAEHPKKSQILAALEDVDTSFTDVDPLENTMVLNMGPQHPATHGVLRVLIKLDGETVLGSVPELGYLHRGYEKIAENATYHEFIPHTDRLDYLAPLSNNVGYVLAVEKLLGIEIPKRAEYIRVLISEMARVASHLVAVGSMAMDVGALTVLLWTFREREKLLDIYDVLCGARFTTSYTRIGGLLQDWTDTCTAMLTKFLDEFDQDMKEVQQLLFTNRIFIERCENVGYISRQQCIDMGMTGPILRASGVPRDLRRDNPYLVYNDLDFDVITAQESDALARFHVRFSEAMESAKILRQAMQKLPAGPICANETKKVLPRKDRVYTKMEELIHDFMLINMGIDPPVGEVYQGIESSKGEFGIYIVSDGTGQPWRLKIRSPSMVNLSALPVMIKGAMVSDIVAIIGSIDPVMGEADK
ncbi:MAG: NADH dehydrogenase (quinone) subunit D [Ignavibacteriae bacterium]|nr:NADH dehydrogenase (quinone) subunit D [Ignavibacteriota bacterium]